MLWCYGLIVKKLSDTRVHTQTPSASFTQSNNQSNKISQKKKSNSRSDADRRRVTIMCAALVSCFIVCWLPFHSVHLAKIVGIENTEVRFSHFFITSITSSSLLVRRLTSLIDNNQLNSLWLNRFSNFVGFAPSNFFVFFLFLANHDYLTTP